MRSFLISAALFAVATPLAAQTTPPAEPQPPVAEPATPATPADAAAATPAEPATPAQPAQQVMAPAAPDAPPPAAAVDAASLPRCSATVQDNCIQNEGRAVGKAKKQPKRR